MAGHTFDRMAPIYEKLTDAYSFGCIPRAKQRQLDHIDAGTRVLYIGVVPGSDALTAGETGKLRCRVLGRAPAFERPWRDDPVLFESIAGVRAQIERHCWNLALRSTVEVA